MKVLLLALLLALWFTAYWFEVLFQSTTAFAEAPIDHPGIEDVEI